GRAALQNEVPFPEIAGLMPAQLACDRRVVVFCDGLDEPRLGDTVALDRGARGIKHETVAAVLAHLFVHQIHHRGQAHAMLSGTPVAPPQLDEYFLTEDARRSIPELNEIGLDRG